MLRKIGPRQVSGKSRAGGRVKGAVEGTERSRVLLSRVKVNLVKREVVLLFGRFERLDGFSVWGS